MKKKFLNRKSFDVQNHICLTDYYSFVEGAATMAQKTLKWMPKNIDNMQNQTGKAIPVYVRCIFHGEKLQLTGQNLGQVFNSRSGYTCVKHFHAYVAKRPNLKWKLGTSNFQVVIPVFPLLRIVKAAPFEIGCFFFSGSQSLD